LHTLGLPHRLVAWNLSGTNNLRLHVMSSESKQRLPVESAPLCLVFHQKNPEKSMPDSPVQSILPAPQRQLVEVIDLVPCCRHALGHIACNTRTLSPHREFDTLPWLFPPPHPVSITVVCPNKLNLRISLNKGENHLFFSTNSGY
jgi:hypothetical protein